MFGKKALGNAAIGAPECRVNDQFHEESLLFCHITDWNTETEPCARADEELH